MREAVLTRMTLTRFFEQKNAGDSRRFSDIWLNSVLECSISKTLVELRYAAIALRDLLFSSVKGCDALDTSSVI